MQAIDINCDVGEGFGAYRLGADAEVVPHVSSANIACGFHAGDPQVMRATVELARAHRVAVGAHPGFPDLMGFGRRALAVTPGELRDYTIYQLGALGAFARAAAVRLEHVKAHGALYNLAATDSRLALALAEGVALVDPSLVFVGLPGSALIAAGRRLGLPTANEVFADRGYRSDGTLVPRGEPGALLQEVEEVAARIQELVCAGVLVATDGTRLSVEAHTICVHGDTPGAGAFARALRLRLDRLGVRVAPMREVVGA